VPLYRPLERAANGALGAPHRLTTDQEKPMLSRRTSRGPFFCGEALAKFGAGILDRPCY